MKKPRRLGQGAETNCSSRLSGLGEVEGRGTGGAEVDGHRLGVVGVDVEAGGGQHSIETDRAAQGVAQGAAAEYPVGVQLEGGAVLLALQHVLDHAVGEGGIFVGHVDRCCAGAIAETRDVGAEGNVLTGGLADGGYVDFSAADLEAPVADLTDNGEIGVIHLKLVGSNSRAVVGDGKDGATSGGGNGERTSVSGVAQHVVGGGGRNRRRQSACTGFAGLAVHHAEFHGVADLEVQVRSHGDNIRASVDLGFAEGAGGAGGLVVEGAGRAGQNGGCHWAYQR
jgi:hypothetical protein